MSSPTQQAYNELRQAYDFFNVRLFEGQLPSCLIVMQRKNRRLGQFSGDRWNDQAGAITDEIAMNPTHFASRGTADVLSTLVHEMVHLWQHHFGTPGRGNYHNKEWAAMMDVIGLCPSKTGAPGGERTGQPMSHYTVEGGPYERVCGELLATGFLISWRDRVQEDDAEPGKTPGKNGVRVKYTCSGCGLNAWAKSDAVLVCGDCDLPLDAVGVA